MMQGLSIPKIVAFPWCVFSRRCHCPFPQSPGTSACLTRHGAQKCYNCMSTTIACVRWQQRVERSRKGLGRDCQAIIAPSSMRQVLMQTFFGPSACFYCWWSRMINLTIYPFTLTWYRVHFCLRCNYILQFIMSLKVWLLN